MSADSRVRVNLYLCRTTRGHGCPRSRSGSGRRRRGRRRGDPGCFQIVLALAEALEEFVAFAQAADANIFVLEHRLDDAENRFRAEVIAAIQTGHRLKYFGLSQA